MSFPLILKARSRRRKINKRKEEVLQKLLAMNRLAADIDVQEILILKGTKHKKHSSESHSAFALP